MRRSHRRDIALGKAVQAGYILGMFTIEHDFDATIVTLIDEGGPHLTEDVTVNAFEDCVTLEQENPRDGRIEKITLSMVQVRDLAAALDLPEGVYRLRPPAR